MFIVHVHCSLFMFIVHCSHGATLIFDDLFFLADVPRFRLLVHCAPTVAARFHKRHLATFLGNPEFKLFIQQLAEVSLSSRK